MGIKEMEEAIQKMDSTKPETAELLRKILNMKKGLGTVYEKESISSVNINNAQARIIVYKKSKIEVHFRDNAERDAAIRKLLA